MVDEPNPLYGYIKTADGKYFQVLTTDSDGNTIVDIEATSAAYQSYLTSLSQPAA